MQGGPLGAEDFVYQVALGYFPQSSGELEWTDLSGYVFGTGEHPLSIRRGRDDVLADMQTGEAAFVLDNSTGDWDPNNPAGPHYTYLRVNTPLRILSTWSGSAEDVWRGTMPGWIQDVQEAGWREVPVQALGHFEILRNIPVSRVFPAERSDQRFVRLMMLSGLPSELYTPTLLHAPAAGQASISARTVREAYLLDEIYRLARTEHGACFESKAGVITWHGRDDAIENTSVAILGDTGAADELPVLDRGIRLSPDATELYNLCTVTREGASADRGAFDVVVVGSWILGVLADFAVAGAVEFVVEELEGDIPAGAWLNFGPASMVRLSVRARAGDTTIYCDATYSVLNEGDTARYNPGEALAGDNDSQYHYGVRPVSRSGTLFSTQSEAQALAELIVMQHATPRNRIEGLVFCSASRGYVQELSALMLSLELRQQITVRHAPRDEQGNPLGYTVEQVCTVEGIELRLELGYTECELQLSPALTDDFLTLDTDSLDSGAKLYV